MTEPEETPSFEDLLTLLANDRQREFCRHFITCLVATTAAKRAKYAEGSAHVEGSRLLRDPKIRAAVDAGLRELGESAHISRAWVLEKLKQTFDRANEAVELQACNRSLMILAKSLGMLDKDLNVNVLQSGDARIVLYFPDNERGPKPKGKDDGNDKTDGTDREATKRNG